MSDDTTPVEQTDPQPPADDPTPPDNPGYDQSGNHAPTPPKKPK